MPKSDKILNPALLQNKGKIAIAVSGGSDSMALALLFNEFARDIEIVALTVDHGLRSESAEEAKRVGGWLEKYGIEHHILKWEGEKKTVNIQATARKARYKLMADYCQSHHIKSLAVAHTLNDQAETVFMRIMRGSGVDGIAGIAENNNLFGINVIRPLLQASREELREYLREKKQEWVEDPSNENTKFTRVQVRKIINSMPEPELFTKRLADVANHMQRAKDYIEQRMEGRTKKILTFHEEGFYTLSACAFKDLHTEERLRLLSSALKHVSGREYKPRFENVELLDKNILSGNIGAGCTSSGCEIVSGKKKGEGDIIFIYREPAQAMEDIDIKPGLSVEWDGRFLCNIGKIEGSGFKLGALGRKGLESITNKGFKLQLLKAKEKIFIPKKVIYTLPALKVLEKVVAVPHIGYYCNENFKEIIESMGSIRLLKV